MAYAIDRCAHLAALAIDRCRGLDFLSRVEPAEAGLDPARAFRSTPSGDRYLRNVLSQLEIRSGDRILDVGCGKGSAMRCMLRFPFARVDGIELAPALAAIAERNFARLGRRRARVFAMDACSFTGYGDYRFIYFYNPFPPAVMEPVARSIANSMISETVLIYNNPTCHDQVAGAGFHLIHTFPDRWGNGTAIYASHPHGACLRRR